MYCPLPRPWLPSPSLLGGDPNTANNRGLRPIHVIANCGPAWNGGTESLDVLHRMRVLLSHPAIDVDAPHSGRSVLQLAERADNTHVAALLQEEVRAMRVLWRALPEPTA